MTANTLWSIAFGDYEFTIDRKALTYRLVETKTGTVWANWLSVGSIEFEDRQTGERTTVDLSQTKLVSLSEKASPQGKRILFGLDWNGLPIDINFTCSLHEIELIVEASRDTRTHRVQDIVLLPGLCSVPEDGVSYQVLPYREGAILRAEDFPPGGYTQALPIWDAANGLVMPFFGAVRQSGNERTTSALGLITDSAYAQLDQRRAGTSLTSDLRFLRDPERRRLDLRIALFPEGNAIDIARSYREKLIRERSHIPLRRKSRERTRIDSLLGGALVLLDIQSPNSFAAYSRDVQTFAEAAQTARILKNELGVEQALCVFSGWAGAHSDAGEPLDAAGGEPGLRAAVAAIQEVGFLAAASVREHFGFDAVYAPDMAYRPLEGQAAPETRWEDMDQRLQAMASVQNEGRLFGSSGGCDWSAIGCDFWTDLLGVRDVCEHVIGPPHPSVPLYATVYHDCVVSYPLNLLAKTDDTGKNQFLRALLSLSPPLYRLTPKDIAPEIGRRGRNIIRSTYAVLGQLHRLSFSAFLNSHRFLTSDFTVEEARYTNGARVLINQSETEEYVTDELHLPPLGFYAEHAQMTAHYALRIGSETFPRHAWRIVRSQDGKPLAESADVLREEFAVEPK